MPIQFSPLQLAKSMNLHIRTTSPPVTGMSMSLVDPAWPPELQALVVQIAQMLDGQAQRDTDAVALAIARTRMQVRTPGDGGVLDAKTPAGRR